MRLVPLQKQGLPRTFDNRPCTPQNVEKVVSDLASQLALEMSQDEVNSLANAIVRGGSQGMAVAVFIVSAIAEANYQYSPRLVNTITLALDQPSCFGLHMSYLIKMKLIHWRPGR